jgi:hypothetical protein
MVILLFAVVGLLVVVLWLLLLRVGQSQEEGFAAIPSTIWTFWDGDSSPLVKACIASWKRHNPNYEIILLNKGNLSTYLPEVDFSSMRHVHDSVQRFSDFVRVHVLAQHGGIWIDGSTICQAPLDWMIQQNDAEFIGYFTDAMTLPKWREASPVLENWAFACIPGSPFMLDWRDEMMKMTTYDDVADYSRSVVKNEGVDPQKIPGAPDDISYFAMHLAAQRLLQTQRDKKYRLHLLCAEETALVYLCEPGSHDIVLTEESKTRYAHRLMNREFPDQPLLKMPGYMRNLVEQLTSDYTSFV